MKMICAEYFFDHLFNPPPPPPPPPLTTVHFDTYRSILSFLTLDGILW